jgi:hypothetical protein
VAGLLGKSKQAVSTDKSLLRLEMRDGSVGLAEASAQRSQLQCADATVGGRCTVVSTTT